MLTDAQIRANALKFVYNHRRYLLTETDTNPAAFALLWNVWDHVMGRWRSTWISDSGIRQHVHASDSWRTVLGVPLE